MPAISEQHAIPSGMPMPAQAARPRNDSNQSAGCSLSIQKANLNMKIVSILLLLLLLPALADTAEFLTLEKGLEYREVKLDSPRPLTMIQLRCDPREISVNLLLSTDLKGKPKSTTAGRVARELGQVAVINSSYFGHKMEILGYTERYGEVLNSDIPEGIFSAFFYWDGGRAGFKRRGESLPSGVPVLFQAGPRLVWDGEAIGGLDSEALANRTILSVDEEGRLGIVVIGGLAHTTLSELPALLLKPVAQGGMASVRALNLDGGSSTQFYLQSGSTKKSLPGRAKVPVFLGISKRSGK